MTLNVFKIFGILCSEKDIQNNYCPNAIYPSVENMVGAPGLQNFIYKHRSEQEPISQKGHFLNV